MAKNEKFFEKTRQSAQEKCDVPVIAVGVFQPRGSLGFAAAVPMLPGAAFFGPKLLAKGTGLPQIGVYAVTDHDVRVFPAKVRGFGVKLKDEVARFPRNELSVEQGSGKLAPAITVTHIPTGNTFELEGSAFADTEAVQRFAALFTQ